MPQDFVNGYRSVDGHPFASVRIESNVERALEDADVVMALRLQLERQKAGHLPSLREYSRMYGITRERLKLAKPDVLVMHPGPMNEGVEIDSEVAHGARSVIEEQVANGVAVRMALLYALVPAPRAGV
jgi:aspartate carbamoyltransferase catalytic subunit